MLIRRICLKIKRFFYFVINSFSFSFFFLIMYVELGCKSLFGMIDNDVKQHRHVAKNILKNMSVLIY